MSDTQDNTQQETNQETGRDLRTKFETQLAEISEKSKAEIEKILQEKLKIEQELNAIKQAEEEKNKTLEEKLAEAKKNEEELSNLIKLKEKQLTLDKVLLKENINPEFMDLINREGLNLYSDESSVEEVITNLKTKYPSAFQVPSNKPVNIGSPTTSSGSTLTKEQAAQMVNDPELYRKHRSEIIKALYS